MIFVDISNQFPIFLSQKCLKTYFHPTICQFSLKKLKPFEFFWTKTLQISQKLLIFAAGLRI